MSDAIIIPKDTKYWKAEDFWSHWITSEDVLSIAIYEFDLKSNEYPTPTQCDMVRDILFGHHRRILWNCFTRYGKSWIAGLLIALYVLLNQNKKVNIVGPQRSQAMVIMKNFTKFMLRSRTLINELVLEGSRKAKMGKKTSQTSYVLANGCEINTLGVHGEGKGAMGEGGDLNIVDELGLIEPKTYREKVHRLLGDDSANSVLLGIFNPWSQDTIAYEFYNNSRYHKVHVDYKKGLAEGRITQEYIDEQRELCDETEFTVLFESKFPKQTIDTLLKHIQVYGAINRKVKHTKYLEVEFGVDVARFGSDRTSISIRKGMNCFYHKKHSGLDTMQTVAEVGRLLDFYLLKGYFIRVNVDDTGVGGGVTDRLKELFEHQGVIVIGIDNGSSAANPKYFNKTAELWYWIKKNIDLIQLPNDVDMVKDFTRRKYRYLSGGKIRLESKDEMKARGLKSPDSGDSISYAFASLSDIYEQYQDESTSSVSSV